MKTALIAAVAVAAIATSSAAHASTALLCNVVDTQGSHLTYAFGGNSANADGVFGGTMVETGFEKNGKMVISEVGQRPIWIFGGNALGGFNLYSRAAPGWTLAVGPTGEAILNHNGRFAAVGACQRAAAQQTAGDVGDLGE